MDTFAELGLNLPILEAIQRLGFETPTEIQRQAIPHILSSEEDLIALAQTGTGKTGAFGLPCLQKVDPEERIPQVLVLSPTRELALQTAREVKKFAKKIRAVRVVAVYGGGDLYSQSQALRNGCHIVVGTPGRTLDFIRRGKLNLEDVSMVVLDEADEMLKMGFQEDLEAILSETPDEKQVLLFSATMPVSIEKIAHKYMNSPAHISIGKRNEGTKMVKHAYCLINRKDRHLALQRLVDAHPSMYGLIFCRTKIETLDVVTLLRKDGHQIDVLNGDLSQKQRDQVMRQFRRRELQLLVATDVAARGLDVHNVTHVINFNLPDDLEVYVHRSGRTGRAGKSGMAFTLVSPQEKRRLRALEKMVGQSFERQDIPSGQQINEAQLLFFLNQLEQANVSDTVIERYSELISEKIAQYSAEEVVARLLTMMCGQVLQKYLDAPDLNAMVAQKSSDKRRKGKNKNRNDKRDLKNEKKGKNEHKYPASNGRFTRCKINIGRRNGLSPNRLMGVVNEFFSGKKPDFGRIHIEQNRCFFDVQSDVVRTVVDSLQGQIFEGRRVEISIDE